MRRTSPSPRRIRAAVATIVKRVQPDQIILFGSGARGEMTAQSDVDLLVIRNEKSGPRAPEHHDWYCDQTEDNLDVVLMSRAMAEQGRNSAAYIQGPALAEGRTLYTRPGAVALPTGPARTVGNDGNEQPRTLFEPDNAERSVERAERRLRSADREEEGHDKCERVHGAIKHALRALIVAQGRRMNHKRTLNELWNDAEAYGHRINATQTPPELDELDAYANAGTEDATTNAGALRTASATRPTASGLVQHAREYVTRLVETTRKQLGQLEQPTGQGTRTTEPNER